MLANVAQHLNRYVYDTLGDRPLAAIRPSEVQAWATAVLSRLAPSTVRTVANTIKAVFAAAVRDRIIVFNPCDGLVLPQLPRRRVELLSIDQVQAIYGTVPDQYRALIAVAVGTRLRSGELFGVQLRHIDFAARTLTVDQQVQQLAGSSVYVGPPKTPSSYRTVPLPQLVVDELPRTSAATRPTPTGACSRRRTADRSSGRRSTTPPGSRPQPPRRTQPLTCFAYTSTQESTPDHGAACGPAAD